MQRKAIGAFALAATLAGVSASAGTVEKFNVQFDETGYTLDNPPWTNTTDAEVSTAQHSTGTASLYVDSDTEVTYTPSASDVSVVSLDVYLTAGSTAPEFPNDAKLVIYLDSTGELKGRAKGDSNWTTIASNVQPNVWTNITMTFTSSTVTVKTKDGDYQAIGANVGSTITSVGFKGTGYIDNFVGSCEMNNYAYTDGNTGDGDGTEDAGSAVISVDQANHAVSFNYSGVSNMKFVRVYDSTGKYVTLRTTDNLGSIDTSKLSGTISKVVAYYGNNVSNVDSQTKTTPESAVVDNESGTMKVGVNVEAKSGVYYSLVDETGTTRIPNSSEVLATPAQDGATITLTAPVSETAWGAVKFKVKASDTSSASN